ncbi:MAG TPA: chemotaxis protein CheW [Rhodocyclaceae bacterium]|nr:chemotaxis protein CheW [Rhodocyclaceae bacterium]
MAIDMSQFYQVFFEEAAEHLGSMESLLLGLDVGAPDAEELNAIFRAAHSIKGSAGTFGFTDMADVTHIVENLLDRVRKGEMSISNSMIDIFLTSIDVLRGMLSAHRGEGQADADAAAAICETLRQLADDTRAAPSMAVLADNPQHTSVATSEFEPESRHYLLRFVLEPMAVLAGDNLLAELARYGAVRVLHRPSQNLSDPWELELDTASPVSEIRDVLEYLVCSDSLSINEKAASSANDDEAYGFFDDAIFPEVTAPVPGAFPQDDPDGAFGFFTDDASDDSYGFFEPLPAAEPSVPDIAAASPAVSAAASADDPDGAFGFFIDPVPLKASAPEISPSPASPVKPASASAKAGAPKPTSVLDSTIRVGVEKVDQLINLIGELVITQAMLTQSASNLDPVVAERLNTGLAQLERNTRDLQESVMSIRMMPISVVFSRFPRVVRELSQKLGKQVELKLIGEHTELDRGLIERIADPLTHLIRNSLDHGIELPDVRTAKGKSATGTVTLKAYHQSGSIVIEVGDDGAGLNREKILSKAKERGLQVSDGMSDYDVWQLIFEAGFSTADQVTEVSGRGVGMDVVKRNIASMGGRVDIDSITGIGTRMTVRLPLTLAILDGMSVAVGRETYIIPLGYVVESLQVSRSMIKSVTGLEKLIQVRDEYLPLVALHQVFQIPDAQTQLDMGIVVVIEADGIKAAMSVDALVGQHQVVIKSLESNYRKVAGVSGATIMGDGRVALILDVAALVAMARSTAPAAA